MHIKHRSYKNAQRHVNRTIIVQPKIIVSQKEKAPKKTIINAYEIDEWFRTEYNRLLAWSNKDKRVGSLLCRTLEDGDMIKVVELFNIALATIPHDNPRGGDGWRNEYWYRSMFMMLLRGAEIISYAEVHVKSGRSDLVIQFDDTVIVIEFKVTHDGTTVQDTIQNAINQIHDNGYAKGYETDNRRVIRAAIVADDPKEPVKIEVSKE